LRRRNLFLLNCAFWLAVVGTPLSQTKQAAFGPITSFTGEIPSFSVLVAGKDHEGLYLDPISRAKFLQEQKDWALDLVSMIRKGRQYWSIPPDTAILKER